MVGRRTQTLHYSDEPRPETSAARGSLLRDRRDVPDRRRDRARPSRAQPRSVEPARQLGTSSKAVRKPSGSPNGTAGHTCYRFSGTASSRIGSTSANGRSVRFCASMRAAAISFTGRGREPDRDPYAYALSVDLDGSDLRLLTPEPANHTVRLSPRGGFIVDMYHRVDLPPISSCDPPRMGESCTNSKRPTSRDCVRRDGGSRSRSRSKHVTASRSFAEFTVRKRHATSTRRRNTPLIDNIYPGPQSIITPRSF